MRIFDWLFGRTPPSVDPDGFGQGMVDDLRFERHFRRARLRDVRWRVPTAVEVAAIEGHPILGRFGDHVLMVAEVDDERWIVRDRDWFGWPDPPEYAFFALAGDTIRAATDFDEWPPRWTLPDDLPDYSIVTPTTFQSPPS
ncbi:hypothetical protein ASE67_09150 [Sphingomonas sp. Leaf23]|uniref:hypothetical protein n=1 Tax=Sphingomonas sp. Leaf23 TaxID=1735689 RepID=UPI0006FD12D1|nr:hypothetical protein [Sphingomonas sp. Leaf23]KQM86028.1 hypothetical protein ASE67_09150 [Sphingomonas sp. Leaf23]